MGKRYEVVPARVWQHTPSGRTASIYGAAPGGEGWAMVSRGWTIRDTVSGTVGCYLGPCKTEAEAQARVDALNAR